MTTPSSGDPRSGWYPDPSGQPGERWWNGSAWTQETRQVGAPAAPPAPPSGEVPAAWDGFGNPVTPPAYGEQPRAYGEQPRGYGEQPPAYGQQPPAYGQRPPTYAGAPAQGSTPPSYGATPPTYGGTPPTYGATPPPYAGGPAGYPGTPGGPRPSFLARNSFSFATVGIAVVYLLILVFAHFAILGILPLFTGFRAVGRKEPLAWVAVVVGVLALVIGIYEFTR